MTKFKSILAAIALAAFAPLALTGCATIASWTEREQVATYDERALLTAELAYSFVLEVINNAAMMGAVDREMAERLIPVVDQAQAAITRARAAYAAGNALDGAVATQDAVAQVAAITALLQEFGLLRRNGG